MGLNLTNIDRVKTITKEDFIKNYFKPQKPVVIENFVDHWPAYSKWSLEYMKEVAGDKTVPLYDDRPVDYKDGFNEPHATMKMSEYVDLLKENGNKYASIGDTDVGRLLNDLSSIFIERLDDAIKGSGSTLDPNKPFTVT